MAENTSKTLPPEPKFEIPKGLTIDWAIKNFGETEGTKFYHDTARNFGFGDFRNESFAGGFPALDLNGLAEKDFQTLEKQASELKAKIK